MLADAARAAGLGSIQRFTAMLLEHYRGDLPLWLVPDQVVVASIGPAQAAYARRVADELEHGDLRVAVDDRPQRLSRKIVDAREGGIPVLMAVGAREEREGTVSVRFRDGKLRNCGVAEAVDLLRAEACPLGRHAAADTRRDITGS
jgi:threonyl-tRNA synthetase